MERQLVSSSNIAEVGYDAETRTMEVLFKSGGLYRHTEVSPEQHAALVGSASIGKHYNDNFRGVRVAKVR